MGLKVASYDIVFQEVPDEVSLALNISGCPNRCAGCHSAHLMEDVGEELTFEMLSKLVENYLTSITCVCFMGGDIDPKAVEALSRYVHQRWGIKSAWYSGREEITVDVQHFDYIKIGRYREELGALNSPTTNQRFYQVTNHELRDITYRFWR